MSEEVIVYHGSDNVVKPADIVFPGLRDNCDFGRGFYLAQSKETAEEWVISQKSPVVNIYMLNSDNTLYLHGRDWIKVIVGFRKRAYKVHFRSSVICGPIANDRMVPSIDLFMEGVIGDLRLIKCLDLCKLGNQYALIKSASEIKFVDSYTLSTTEVTTARERAYKRRDGMSEKLRNIQRTSINGELFVEDYIKGGDFVEK